MPIKMSLISLLAAILALAMIAAADEIKTDITAHQINQGFTVIYPDDYSPRLATDVVCSVQLAGDPYWGIADWLIGDEIYKTYQDPTVTGIDCEFPFEVQAVAMMLQFATGGSVVASVDIECLDSAESTPSCPYPGTVLGISSQWEYTIPSAGLYLFMVPMDEPVTVTSPYFCGFYIAEDITAMGPEIITDADPYLCVNWNNWGEGYVDLADNQYYNFPGNLILYSVGVSGSGGSITARPEFCWPSDSMQVSGNVYLRASELTDSNSFAYCRFEYYHLLTGWTIISDDPSQQVTLRNSMSPSSYQEGYSAIWNTAGLSEGWYKLRASVFNAQGNNLADTITVYLDNTPLKPAFTNPLWLDSLCDSITLRATVPDEDVNYLQFEYRAAVDTIKITPPSLLQSRYGDIDGDTLDGNNYAGGEYGDFYNAPVAATCLIRYFSTQGYTSLTKNGAQNLTNRQIVEQLADSIAIRANLGAEDDNFLWAIAQYFKVKGNQFETKLITTLTPELLDFVMGYRKGAALAAIGQPYGHWLVIKEFAPYPDASGKYYIKVYDTKSGFDFATNIIFNPLPQIEYYGVYRVIDLTLALYPRIDPSARTVIGMDFNPADGFAYFWDFGELGMRTIYLTALGFDNASHSGEDVTRGYLVCTQGYVPSDVNADGSVDVSDAVWIINYVFTGGPPPKPNIENGDANCDGSTDVSDAVWIINYVFAAGPPPCNK